MQQFYQPIYKEAKHLAYRVHDTLDQPSHSLAQSLKREAQRLLDMLEVDKNARDIEGQLQTILHTLHEMRHGGEAVMSVQDVMSLEEAYDHMRLGLRRLPNY